MKHALLLVAVLAGCGKKPDPATKAGLASAGSGSAKAAGTGDSDDDNTPTGPGVVLANPATPEFSGSYDKAFARLSNADEGVTIAFVRGCPTLVCTDNVFEIESIAGKCPKAFLGLATLPKGSDGNDPKPGTHRADIVFAGPADKASTITLGHVKLEISELGPDGITGKARHKTTDGSVKGPFKAEICGRM